MSNDDNGKSVNGGGGMLSLLCGDGAEEPSTSVTAGLSVITSMDDDVDDDVDVVVV